MEKPCARCGYKAQYTWSGFDVCGKGCFELLMIANNPNKNRDIEFEIIKLLDDNFSIQAIQDALDNIIKNGESVRLPSTTYSRYYPASQTWVIELSKYHRDNLLWLFNVIGYPYGGGIEPFTFANTGDWVGEIPIMLSKPGGKSCVLDEGDRPNKTAEDLKRDIDNWLKRNK